MKTLYAFSQHCQTQIQETREIPEALTSLEKGMTLLKEEIDTIEQALSPVLHPTPPDGENGTAIGSVTALGGAIARVRDDAFALGARLAAIRGRIEL